MHTLFMACFILFTTCILSVCCQHFTEQSQSHKIGNHVSDLAINYLRWKFPVEESNGSQNASEILELCRSFIVEFGKQASNFIECSVDNARPFRFCEGCIEYYEKVTTVYKDIQKDDEHMSDCRRLLLNSDRVQIINNIYTDITGIWETADCDKCFESMSEDSNGTVTYALKETTKQFVMLYANFTKCIPKREELNETVCVNCARYYTDMNTMFEHDLLVNPDSPHRVCMDIVDMMNYTRLLWGDELNCTRVHKELAPIVSIASIVFMVPVVFYVSLRVYGARKTQELMLQKRFSQYGTSPGNGSNRSFNPSQDMDNTTERRPAPSLYSMHGSSRSINSPVISPHSPIQEITHRPNVGTMDTS